METIDITQRHDFLRLLPATSGVYIFRDAAKRPLYVGKAQSLKKRVPAYFIGRARLDARLTSMCRKIRFIDFETTLNQSQALLLEAACIKQYKPRYNIAYRDDKSYPYIKIEKRVSFPRIRAVREVPRKDAWYFGPYTNAKLLRKALEQLRRVFAFRSCKTMPKKPCLYYHVKLCQGPCARRISPKDYAKNVRHIMDFLRKGRGPLLKRMYGEMQRYATHRDFESAIEVRDRIRAFESVYRAMAAEGLSALEALQVMLGLPRVPRIIECFDIACISGTAATGSMAQWIDGRPYKDGYRKFKIRTVQKMDDYAMMREVLHRRYARVMREGLPIPDLVLIDGGKGHLHTALSELKKLKIQHKTRVVAIAKQFETLYVQGRKNPLQLSYDSQALRLLQRIRDEAHRFAQRYHHHLRAQELVSSLLDGIPGMGPALKKKISMRYGSPASLGSITKDELYALGGMSLERAETIAAALRARYAH